MKRLVPALAALVVACSTPGQTPPRTPDAPSAEQGERAVSWRRLRVRDGVVVYRAEVSGSPFVAVRGETDVAAPVVKVASIVTDVERSAEWLPHVVASKTVRQVSPTSYVTWALLDSPPLVKDRDIVCLATLEPDPNGTIRVTMRSIVDPAMPPGDPVRAEVERGLFELVPIDAGHTRVVAEMHVDPKGSLPGWLVNRVQERWPVLALGKLREIAERAEPRDSPRLRAVLAEKGYPGVSAPE